MKCSENCEPPLQKRCGILRDGFLAGTFELSLQIQSLVEHHGCYAQTFCSKFCIEYYEKSFFQSFFKYRKRIKSILIFLCAVVANIIHCKNNCQEVPKSTSIRCYTKQDSGRETDFKLLVTSFGVTPNGLCPPSNGNRKFDATFLLCDAR